MNGAQSLFKALVDAGITTCFANPGTSEMQLVYEIGMTDKVRPVLCLQEDVVTGAADGYARMTGAPAFTLLHVGSGFGNGIAMLHNAGRANTPIVNVVGANASYHQPNNPEHELINGHITDLARVVSHWAQEARSASNLGELGAEAAALAKTGKICTIVAPTNWHWEEANPPPIVPASPGRPKTAAEAIARAATMLKNGKKTGLVLGNLALHGEALNIAGRIAAKTGAALLSEIFPSYHLSRGEGRPPVDPIPYEFEIGLKFLQPFEQLIFVGALFPVATFAYKNKPTMKSPPGCDLFVMASVEQDLTAALRSLAEASGRGRRGGAPSASHRGRGAKRRPDGRSHRAVALHVDAGKRHSRRRSGDQWPADLRGDEGRSRARLSRPRQWGGHRGRSAPGSRRGDRLPRPEGRSSPGGRQRHVHRPGVVVDGAREDRHRHRRSQE